MDWWLALFGAIVVGALGNLAYEIAKYGTLRTPRRLLGLLRGLPRVAREYDVRADGLVTFVSWSRERLLDEQNVSIEYLGRPVRSHLFDDDVWWDKSASLAAEGYAGRTAYPVGMAIDHHEHEEAFSFRMKLAESSYPEALATFHLARADEERRAQLRSALNLGLDHFLKIVPPTSMSISVAVTSPRGRTLILRRSAAVTTLTNQWTVGINETMKYSDEPGAGEGLYDLVRRGLREELGLMPENYGRIHISWLGWSEPVSCFHAVALVGSALSEEAVDERRAACHSIYEHDATSWVPVSKGTVIRVLERRPCPDGTRNWSYLAPLVCLELWRYRHLLG